jgi:release factor glutamine methyltransferase
VNARRNGVSDRSLFVVSDWCAALGGRFDLIVSNPPYIATAVLHGLETEVRDHDPTLALDGGADGLDAYRSILSQAAKLLAADGHLVVEIGFDQEGPVKSIAATLGFAVARFVEDLAGQPRCLALKRT